jgi:Cu/Ag efflux protein CusF
MTIVRLILAGTAALTIISSAAAADQALTGVITGLNRLNGTIAIQQMQSGTVGASAGGASEEFKVGDGVSLDAVHAGDRVSFSTTDKGGTKTVTKLERQ